MDSGETYPHAMAMRSAASDSFSDPSAVSKRNRALPRAAPKPSAKFNEMELSARRSCEAKSRSLR